MNSDFLQEIASIRPKITLAESEETWDTIAASISKLSNLIRNGMPNEIIAALREFSRNIASALKSERTRLCGPAMDLITAVSAELGMSFEPLLPIYFPVLLAVCARSNKVVVNKARATVFAVIGNAQLSAVLPYLLQNIKDKSTSLRLVVAESTLACLDSLDPKDLQKDNRSNDIEAIIKATSRDANADVRKAGKRAFMKYKVVLPNRVDTFVAPLTPTIRKYLEIRPKDSSAPAPKAGPSKVPSQKPGKPQPHPLSSSTSAVPTSRSTHVSTSRPERPISVPPPAITTDITASTNTNTLTASQRDAVKSAMAGAPKRPLPSSTSHSNAMPPPTMPVRPGRPGTTASNSNTTSLQRAPERPTHSRTMSQPSVAGTSAPVRMPAPPMRTEKVPANALAGTAPPPPQRFAVSSSTETSRERNAGPKKPELPKLQPEPVPRTRTRTVSMKNPKPATNLNEASTHVDTSKSTTAIHSATNAAPLPRSKSTTVLPKTTKPSTSTMTDVNQKLASTTTKPSKPLSKETTATTTKSVAPGSSKPIAPSKPSAPASKPTSTTASKSATTAAPINKPAPRPRPGLTAPTAASQSRMQTKKSIVNLKGDRNTAPAVKGLQTKKSIASIRADKEKEIPRPKSRARSQTVTSATSSRPPSRRDQSRPPSRRADAEPVSRPPSRKDEQVHPPPSRKDEVEQVEEIELDGEQAVDEAENPQPSEEPVVPVAEESGLNSTSPEVVEQETDNNSNKEEEQGQAAPSTPQIVAPEPHTPVTTTTKKIGDQTKTPISTLLLSIEEGFMFSPAVALSPPEKYLNMPTKLEGGFRFGVPAPGRLGGPKTGEKVNVEGREALGEVGNQ